MIPDFGCPKQPRDEYLTSGFAWPAKHCWHMIVRMKGQKMVNTRKCCFCGRYEEQHSEEDKSHGPFALIKQYTTVWRCMEEPSET